MAEPTFQQVLEQLAAQGAQLRAVQAELACHRRRRRTRRFLPHLAVVLLVALMPASLLATTPFTDLTGGVHDANIDAIYQAGVTKGCVPDQQYCPTNNVTREEMASFLARLGGLGDNPPVANAKTAQSAISAQTAQDAQTLGGKLPADFLPATGTLLYRYSFYNVTTGSTGVTFAYNGGPEVLVTPTTANTKILRLGLDAPSAIFNRGLAVSAAELCYSVEGGAAIAATRLFFGRLGVETDLYLDTVVRNGTSPGCYVITVPNPQVTAGAIYLTLVLNFPALTDRAHLYSVRLTLIPVSLT